MNPYEAMQQTRTQRQVLLSSLRVHFRFSFKNPESESVQVESKFQFRLDIDFFGGLKNSWPLLQIGIVMTEWKSRVIKT